MIGGRHAGRLAAAAGGDNADLDAIDDDPEDMISSMEDDEDYFSFDGAPNPAQASAPAGGGGASSGPTLGKQAAEVQVDVRLTPHVFKALGSNCLKLHSFEAIIGCKLT